MLKYLKALIATCVLFTAVPVQAHYGHSPVGRGHRGRAPLRVVPVRQTVIVREANPIVPIVGLALGCCVAAAAARENQRQYAQQVQVNNAIAHVNHQYNSVDLQLSNTPSHPVLTIPDELALAQVDSYFIDMPEGRRVGYVFKRKFSRVLADGQHVEWLWSLDLTNETFKYYIFDTKAIHCQRVQVKIDLIDADDFVLSTCNFFTDIHLEFGQTANLQGKWTIPYDQMLKVTSYRITLMQGV